MAKHPRSWSSIHDPRYILGLLFAINFLNFFDRQILAAVIEPLRREWVLSDTQLGWLVTAFTLLYAVVGLPLGKLADVKKRSLLLSSGLAIWSGLTLVSGLCRNFWELFGARLGVGIGEAVCAPAASSLIGDLFPARERSRAMSLFMLGLPFGVALSFLVGGAVAEHYGWRAVFYVAGIPGLLLAWAASHMVEPARGRVETSTVGGAHRTGSAVGLVLGIPTMRWIIVSGLLHNFIMYALTFFLPSFLVRHHQASVQTAGLISAVAIGAIGSCGMLAGGWLGDYAVGQRQNGRLTMAGITVLLASPAALGALLLPSGELISFLILQGLAAFLMYAYYPAVYATIQDVVEPALRGRAMAIYFFAMYLLGASMGPVATGWLSDFFARRAALFAGIAVAASSSIPEQFRAQGLQQAMFVIPALSLVLAAVLFMGAARASDDVSRLEAWMKKITSDDAGIRRRDNVDLQ